ncbi:unnamed protein product [Polarella glacialis]|uniref:Uncharacterized protein n=1 Tax=Polarella glacialis TaxID=89957 RepID=A0A813HBQ5_POLGL|nr:unnamed protein product [Polarella glacialis]
MGCRSSTATGGLPQAAAPGPLHSTAVPVDCAPCRPMPTLLTSGSRLQRDGSLIKAQNDLRGADHEGLASRCLSGQSNGGPNAATPAQEEAGEVAADHREEPSLIHVKRADGFSRTPSSLFRSEIS